MFSKYKAHLVLGLAALLNVHALVVGRQHSSRLQVLVAAVHQLLPATPAVAYDTCVSSKQG
jgi:hypothetical protein